MYSQVVSIHQITTFIEFIVDILAAAAAFVGTTVCQMLLRQTVSCHRLDGWFIDLFLFILMCIASLIHRWSILLLSLSIYDNLLSAIATSGGQSFCRRKQWLPKRQQQTDEFMFIVSTCESVQRSDGLVDRLMLLVRICWRSCKALC